MSSSSPQQLKKGQDYINAVVDLLQSGSITTENKIGDIMANAALRLCTLGDTTKRKSIKAAFEKFSQHDQSGK
jgi:hypothetical protein